MPVTHHLALLPLPSCHCPPAIAHLPLPTCHCPPAIAHLPLPTCHCPPAIAHLPLPTCHCPPAIAHMPLPTCHRPPAIAHLPHCMPTCYALPTCHVLPTCLSDVAHLPLPTQALLPSCHCPPALSPIHGLAPPSPHPTRPPADKGLMWETLAGYAHQMSPRCAANVAGGLLPFTYRLYDQRECEHFFRTHMAPQNNDDVVSSRGGVKDGEAWGGAAQGPGGMGGGEAGWKASPQGSLAASSQGEEGGEDEWWIIKMTDAHAGQGTHILALSPDKTPRARGKDCPACQGLHMMYGPQGERCAQMAAQVLPEGTRRTPQQKLLGMHVKHVMQKYVRDPLLIDGRKFHVRMYALVLSTSPLVVACTRRHLDNYVLITPYNYNARDWTDLNGHLTSGRKAPTKGENGGEKQGAAAGKCDEGSMLAEHIKQNSYVRPPRIFEEGWWTLNELDEYLSVERGLVPKGFVNATLIPRFQQAMVMSFRAMEARMAAGGSDRWRERVAAASAANSNKADELKAGTSHYGSNSGGSGGGCGDAVPTNASGHADGGAGDQGPTNRHHYQMFAFDFMLDSSLNTILLEINLNPGVMLIERAAYFTDLATLAWRLFEAKRAGQWPVAPEASPAAPGGALQPTTATDAGSLPAASPATVDGQCGVTPGMAPSSICGMPVDEAQTGGSTTPGSPSTGSRVPRTGTYARDILDLTRYEGLEMLIDGDWELTNMEGCSQTIHQLTKST
eukprot:jgi/Mesvir1/2075/Mv02327-RA.1